MSLFSLLLYEKVGYQSNDIWNYHAVIDLWFFLNLEEPTFVLQKIYETCANIYVSLSNHRVHFL